MENKTDESVVPLRELHKKKINFGKYRGKTYENVFDSEKSYIRWVFLEYSKIEAMKDFYNYIIARMSNK